MRNYKTTGSGRASIRNERGTVIITVLWICALIMWLALRISADNRLHSEEQVHLFRRSQALHLAIGGCYEALARMGAGAPLMGGFDEPSDNSWLPDGRPHVVDYQTGQALVIVEDERKKINVNVANHDQLKAVFEKAGLEGEMAERFPDMIADFVDKDNIPRLHGAEKDQYAHLGYPYPPFDGPLTSLDQLLLIPGMTPQIFYGYGLKREGAEEGPSQEIPTLPGKDSLFQMLSVYGTNTVMRDDSLEKGDNFLPPKPVTWQSGGIYRILSCGKASSGAPTVVVWLIVRYTPGAENGYYVLCRKIL